MAVHMLGLILIVFYLSTLTIAQETSKTTAGTTTNKKTDPNDNKGLTPFFLQDPHDQTCLGANGFTQCDENALWWLTKREGKKTYSLVSFLSPSTQICLQRDSKWLGLFGSDRLKLGSCSKSIAKSWDWDFLDQFHVKLSTQGMCLVRGQKELKNSVSLKPCQKGEYLPLVYQPTTVHEEGFYLKAPDGQCFDGSQFRSCVGSGAQKLMWGIGMKYVRGEPQRYFFNFLVSERNKCLVAKGSTIMKDACSSSGALGWGLSNGQLSYNNGKKCLGRKTNDEGTLIPCKDGFEYISIEVPVGYTNNDAIASLYEDTKELPQPTSTKKSTKMDTGKNVGSK